MLIDGKYRIHAVIGEGGMSSIYRADHLGLDRRVAIKVLHPSLADDPEAIARLRHEAKVVSTIGHPNICEVFDLGRTSSGSPYMVMELLIGESLAERLKANGAMHFMELAPLVKQVLAALQAAHDKGILHRDLKPENVFVELSRRTGVHTAKLLDFGISKSMSYEFHEQQRLTHTGMVMGTPYYMAPEQARGDSGLDQRVDLWAVGVMMYEALTGRRPFVATNYNALLVKILTSRPRPPQKLAPAIPDVAAAIIDRALSKLREDRFQSAREFYDAITHAQRVCATEDPAAPTMMFRRPREHEAMRPASVRGSRRGWEIEDPSTFIDDDFDYDPSQVAGPVKEYQPPPAPEYQSYDDYEAEPVEPTIRERIQPHERHLFHERPTHDTEVMSRPVRERMSSATDSMRDTDVMKRSALFTDAEKTEVVVRSRLEPGEVIPPGVPQHEPALDGDRPTAPVPPPPPSQTRTEPHRRDHRVAPRTEPPPSQKTVVVRPSPSAPGRDSRSSRPSSSSADSRPSHPQARASASVRDRPRRGPPRVPRPDPRPDDEEKTTLFNPERARALRALTGDDRDSDKQSDE